MRIISQDGLYDVPYEALAIRFHENDGTIILGVPLSVVSMDLVSDVPLITLGIYSTETKAQKAMEMLRAAYTGTPLIFENCDVADEVFDELKRRSIEAILTVTNDKPKVDYLDNFYFQFPKDKDLEV